MDLLLYLGIPKYMNAFLWEFAVNFNEHSHAGNKTEKVVPDAQGNPILIIFESRRELGYKKKKKKKKSANTFKMELERAGRRTMRNINKVMSLILLTERSEMFFLRSWIHL